MSCRSNGVHPSWNSMQRPKALKQSTTTRVSALSIARRTWARVAESRRRRRSKCSTKPRGLLENSPEVRICSSLATNYVHLLVPSIGASRPDNDVITETLFSLHLHLVHADMSRSPSRPLRSRRPPTQPGKNGARAWRTWPKLMLDVSLARTECRRGSKACGLRT